MKNFGLSLASITLPSVEYKVETANETAMVNERTVRYLLEAIKDGFVAVNEVKITDSKGTVATFDLCTCTLNNELYGLNPSII